MGVFALGSNGLAGAMAGIEMLPAGWSILMVLPIWNILAGLFSLYQIGLMKEPITDDNATLFEVGIASTTLLSVFIIADFGLRLSWAMTFSLCMAFSSSITFYIVWIVNHFRGRTAR